MKVSLIDALLALDVTNDNHWTSDGLPRVETVQALTDVPVDRKAITACAPNFTRSNPSLEIQDEVIKPVDELPGLTDAEDAEEIPLEIVSEEDDQAKLHALEVGLHELYKQRDELNSTISHVESERDIVTLRLDAARAENPASSLQDYLRSQRKQLESRGLVQKKIVESGVDLNALQKAIAPAPIDVSRRR